MTLSQRNIVLTGFMGAGKSSVGREVAARLRRPFVDMDALIEERQGSRRGGRVGRRAPRSSTPPGRAPSAAARATWCMNWPGSRAW